MTHNKVTDEQLREAVEYLYWYAHLYHNNERDTPRIKKSAEAKKLIEAAISELRAASQWRPIESAPDDTDVLIYTGECATPEIKISMAFCTKGGWAAGFATHWMPLPTPPKEAENDH